MNRTMAWQVRRCAQQAGLAVAALMAALAWGETVTQKSDWLELVKGYKGKALGAELREIEPEEEFGTQSITIAIPKSAIADPDTLEEVRVVGRRPDKFDLEFPLEFTYEWVDDYDNDYYGLVIHIGKDDNVPLRLYMDSRSGFVR